MEQQPAGSALSSPACASSDIRNSTTNDDSDWLPLSDSEPLALHDDDLGAIMQSDALEFLDLLTTTGDDEDITIESTHSGARIERSETNQRKRTYEQRKVR